MGGAPAEGRAFGPLPTAAPGVGGGTRAAIAALWDAVGGDPIELDTLDVSGDEPVLPSIFAVGTAAAASVGAVTLAAAHLGADRGAPLRRAGVDLFESAVSFRSERLLRVDGAPPPELWAPLSGDYPTADGWVRLHCNFEHHRAAAERALGQDGHAPADRSALAAELRRRPSLAVEEAVIAEGGCAAARRSRAVWRAHPQAVALAQRPVVALRRVDWGSTRSGPAPLPRLAPTDRALDGIKVLDLTRVIAGPVCGRVLAGHGAEVLLVGAEHLPVVAPLVIDTGFGKRSCHLDLRTAGGRAQLDRLVGEADVFVQGFRPGALAERGFGAEELTRRHPGLVVVDVSAYASIGPWGGRRGFDSLVQMVSGIADEGARSAGREAPLPLPAQVLDHATGWLAAFGALAALRRRQREGGSWVVDVTLAGTAAWLDSLGRVPGGLATPEPGQEALAPMLEETDSPFGRLRHARLPGRLDGVRPTWATPPVPPATHPPAFTPRSTRP